VALLAGVRPDIAAHRAVADPDVAADHVDEPDFLRNSAALLKDRGKALGENGAAGGYHDAVDEKGAGGHINCRRGSERSTECRTVIAESVTDGAKLPDARRGQRGKCSACGTKEGDEHRACGDRREVTARDNGTAHSTSDRGMRRIMPSLPSRRQTHP
jgi:hypothetical protein